jgi:ubiquinone/menaquinone biosynthesis C-methylase UbiE
VTSDHPIFTRTYAVIAALGERAGLGRLRESVLADARGRLLIVGLGPGHDLDHLPGAVTSVVALEPSDSMRVAAQTRVRSATDRGIAIDVIDAPAERIPLPDDSVDSVLVAYVLCSVDNPRAALAELRRVLRPGGTVHVLEHVRARPGSVIRALQRCVAPVWPLLAGGCQVDRQTGALLEEEGFDVSDITETRILGLPPVAPTLVGIARPLGRNIADTGV